MRRLENRALVFAVWHQWSYAIAAVSSISAPIEGYDMNANRTRGIVRMLKFVSGAAFLCLLFGATAALAQTQTPPARGGDATGIERRNPCPDGRGAADGRGIAGARGDRGDGRGRAGGRGD